MAINQVVFVAIPAAAMFLNLFLLLICINARKNALVYAFMMLMISYSAWTGGAAAMRALLFPGPVFWYHVSLVGIFTVPFMLYNFTYYYTNKKGNFTKIVLGIAWLILTIMSIFDMFLKSPQVSASNGNMTFTYTVTNWVILPFLLGAFTLFLCGKLIYQGVKHDGLPVTTVRPLILGACIMFLGLLSTALPGAGSFPVDPLACGINAMFLFYALYKKRLITFRMVTGRAPLYLAAALLTTVFLIILYPAIDLAYQRYLPEYIEQQTIVISTLVSLLTVLVYNVIRKLLNVLFAKGINAREDELLRFSQDINNTLDSTQILKTFSSFIERNIICEAIYICTQNENGDFVTKVNTRLTMAEELLIKRDSPLVVWLEEQNTAIHFRDFSRTQHYRSMWDEEKQLYESLNIRLVLPVTEGGRLIAVTLFADADNHTICNAGDIVFLESAAAVMSIAIKNAMLYTSMQDEAHNDGLTGLYNRRYFMEIANQSFSKCVKGSFSVAILSLDDFRLFNELYGTHQGDRLLQDFSKMLLVVSGNQGIVGRYSGKEFILAFPFKDAKAVTDLIASLREQLRDYLHKNKGEGQRFLTFSAGISSYPSSATSFEEVISFASIAMYAAKKSGKNKTKLYEKGQDIISVTQDVLDSGEQYMQTIYALTAAVDAKDHYTFNHSEQVSSYAAQLAAEIGLDKEHVDIVRQAGLLHDIGKISIPESILDKPGPLTDEEFQIMKQHVEASIAMIKYIPSLDYVIPAAIGHHERWDGKGYPRGLTGDQIPIGARCLAVADAFDAMTTERSYKPAKTIEEALDEIRQNLGTQFDPKIGLAFVKLVEEGRLEQKQRNS
jgi:diguanylate cyclase (GGDEF)-like protein/putative nucleotidyltransferase with HDIG domain